MNNIETLRTALTEHQAVMTQLESLLPQIAAVAQRLRDCLKQGGKILLMGNGGSAADCQHIAAEIVGRYKRERRGLPAARARRMPPHREAVPAHGAGRCRAAAAS